MGGDRLSLVVGESGGVDLVRRDASEKPPLAMVVGYAAPQFQASPPPDLGGEGDVAQSGFLPYFSPGRLLGGLPWFAPTPCRRRRPAPFWRRRRRRRWMRWWQMACSAACRSASRRSTSPIRRTRRGGDSEPQSSVKHGRGRITRSGLLLLCCLLRARPMGDRDVFPGREGFPHVPLLADRILDDQMRRGLPPEAEFGRVVG